MDRTLSTEILIDYHFGTLPDEARTEVEQALLTSGEALRAYLRLKRELDGGYPASEVPSPAAKARLRTAVAALVEAQKPPRGVRRWLARPVPLYQTIAVAAAVALVTGVIGLLRPPGAPVSAPAASPGANGPMFDSARRQPFSFEVL